MSRGPPYGFPEISHNLTLSVKHQEPTVHLLSPYSRGNDRYPIFLVFRTLTGLDEGCHLALRVWRDDKLSSEVLKYMSPEIRK